MGPPHNKAAQENGLAQRLDDNSESMVFRVLPKGACSTIFQIMDITNHGEVFDGNIKVSLLLVRTIPTPGYCRLFSIEIPAPSATASATGAIFFRSFERPTGSTQTATSIRSKCSDAFYFLRETPSGSANHWSAQTGHISTFIQIVDHYDQIIWTEYFKDGMQSILDGTQLPHPIDLAEFPRCNKSAGHGPK